MVKHVKLTRKILQVHATFFFNTVSWTLDTSSEDKNINKKKKLLKYYKTLSWTCRTLLSWKEIRIICEISVENHELYKFPKYFVDFSFL